MNAAHAPAAARRLDITPAVGLALLGMPAIALVPRVLHVSSVAGAGGYDPAVAHLLLTLLALAVLAIAAVYGWRIALPVAGARPAPPADEGTAPAGGNRGERLSVSLILLVSLLVFVLFLVMYFPPFLARYGPYGEDKYFLSVLQRMEVGQQPYTGFEFIYGPLLIYPMARWMTAFGYSLESYYSLLALVEGATFAGVTAALGLIMPDRRRWFAALAVVLILLVNDNLGISWIALRRLLPVVILLVYAWRGRTRQGAAAVAALIGVQCM
ncbi:MAG: hypothetical protein ACREK1_13915, partial [Longimicrobiales bacterium]